MGKTLTVLFCAVLLFACGDVFEKDMTGRTVEIISPRDGISAPEGDMTFVWHAVEGASKYRLMIVSPDFERSAVVVADTVLYADSLSDGTKYITALKAGSYQWGISAANFSSQGAMKISSFGIYAEEPTDPEE